MLKWNDFIKENKEFIELDSFIKEISDNEDKYININNFGMYSMPMEELRFIYNEKVYEIEKKLFKYKEGIYSNISKEINEFLIKFLGSDARWTDGGHFRDFVKLSYTDKIEFLKGISFFYKKIYNEMGNDGYPKESDRLKSIRNITLNSLDYNEKNEVYVYEDYNGIEISIQLEIDTLNKLNQASEDFLSLEGRIKDEHPDINFFRFLIDDYNDVDAFCQFILKFK